MTLRLTFFFARQEEIQPMAAMNFQFRETKTFSRSQQSRFLAKNSKTFSPTLERNLIRNFIESAAIGQLFSRPTISIAITFGREWSEETFKAFFAVMG
jgi:hypothetical protein